MCHMRRTYRQVTMLSADATIDPKAICEYLPTKKKDTKKVVFASESVIPAQKFTQSPNYDKDSQRIITHSFGRTSYSQALTHRWYLVSQRKAARVQNCSCCARQETNCKRRTREGLFSIAFEVSVDSNGYVVPYYHSTDWEDWKV